MEGSFERRKYKRCVVKVPVNIKSDNSSSEVFSFDLSLGGVRAHTNKFFPVDSKVYITLTLPHDDKEDVSEIKIIGKILRVEEISANGVNAALGIQFQSINENDINLLKEFLKKAHKRSCREKTVTNDITSEDIEDISDEDEPEEETIQVEGLNAEIASIDVSEMSFLERMQLGDDESNLFVRILKGVGKGLFIGLILYVLFYILLIVFKLMDLS